MQIPERLKDITKRFPYLGEIICFGYKLYCEIGRICPSLDNTQLNLAPELIESRLKGGLPFLEKSTIPIPADQFQDTFQRLSLFVADQRPYLKPFIMGLLKNRGYEKADIQRLARLSLNQDADMNRNPSIHGDNPPIINFLIHVSLKPLGRAWGRALNPYFINREDLWHKSFCPVCGSRPILSYLKGEEGRRHLLCSWCDTAWIFPRIQCPYCHNADPKHLSYFMLEDAPNIPDIVKKANTEDTAAPSLSETGKDFLINEGTAGIANKHESRMNIQLTNKHENLGRGFSDENIIKARISVCQKCKKYIKTLDLRETQGKRQTDRQIDDLATLHLDLLAEREGFERITRHILFF